jgi:hypothetical protein
VVANRERQALDWLKELWAGWVVAVDKGQGNERPSFSWRSPTGTASEPFLTGIRPWLRIKGAQCDNALEMISVLKLSRYKLGRRTLPAEWLAEQERHYWIQRELNHRGNKPFVATAMHSPRRINRERIEAASNLAASNLMD